MKIPTIGNEILPFDILVRVFQYYQLDESLIYPFETLLLVCKAWNEAASNYPPLWSTYTIDSYNMVVADIWLRRLPLRLLRSGPTTPLHIDICVFYECTLWSELDTNFSDEKPIIALLNILAGENGTLCARWKSLRFSIDSYVCFTMEGGEHSLKALTYPMPLLTSLELNLYMSPGAVIFPNLPSLTSVFLYNSTFNNYPDVSHALKIEFANTRCWNEMHEPMKVPKVQELHISGDIQSFRHPWEYENLRTLVLEKYNQVSSLKGLSMPSLKTLIIEFNQVVQICAVVDFSAIANIHTFDLRGRLPFGEDRKEVYRIISRLIRACIRLRELRINEYVLSILLEDWHEWDHLFKAKSAIRVFLKGDAVQRKLILGEGDTNVVLERVASDYSLPLFNLSALD
ncbi:hypothetical protein FRC18_005037 [Serendipita sp. 400]|nr:hypothetical protein FRC18_005037 [Serendipita sp. 400]